jgi:nitrate/nitrite transporter NarK
MVPCLAGMAADKCGRTTTVSALFVGLVLSYSWLAMMPMQAGHEFWLSVQASCASAFSFGLAAVYFTLLDDIGLRQEESGAAVGILSSIGFLPDIYVTPMAGYLLDQFSGERGYRLLMAVIATFGIVGLLATGLLTFTHQRCNSYANRGCFRLDSTNS